jgi:hypothetical protein
MLNRIFGMNAQRKEEYLSAPRVMPELSQYALKNIVLSQEYADSKNPAIRTYMAGWQDEGGWAMTEYKIDLSLPDKQVQVVDRHAESIPEYTIKYMLAFEEKCREAGMVATKHPSSKSNYGRFANIHGLHVTKEGKVIKINTQGPITDKLVIDCDAANRLFNSNQSQIHSWDDFYRVLNQMVMTSVHQEREVILTDASLEWFTGWQEERIAEMPELVKDLKRLEFSGWRDCMVSRGEDVGPSLPRLLSYSTSLIGLLRAGAQVFADYVANGMKPSDAKQVRHSKRCIIGVASQELGFNKEQADQIGDLIVKGPDPTAPDYPVRKILQDLIAEKAERERIAEEKRIQGMREAAEAFMRPVKVQPLLPALEKTEGGFDVKVSEAGFFSPEKHERFTRQLTAKFTVPANGSIAYKGQYGLELEVSTRSKSAFVLVFDKDVIVVDNKHVIHAQKVGYGLVDEIIFYDCGISVSNSGVRVNVGTLSKERYLGIEPKPQKPYFYGVGLA